jgi:hypothetical protein
LTIKTLNKKFILSQPFTFWFLEAHVRETSKVSLTFCPKLLLIFVFFYLQILRGVAQPSKPVLVGKNFKFADGIYQNLSDWQRNKPTQKWDSVETAVAVNPTTRLMQMEFLRMKKTGFTLPKDSIWGVVVDGIPYIRLPKSDIDKPTTCFAGVTLRGKLCYFSYEVSAKQKVPITVYIPETGEPFVSKNIVNKTTQLHEKLLLFESGAVRDLTIPNLKTLIADDKELSNSLNELKPNEVTARLFQCVLIYNDRNPVFLK